MDYITNYYKNLSEQLQEKVNILNNNLKYLTEMEAPIPTQGNPGQGTGIPPYGGIDPGMFNPKFVNPSDINPRYNFKPPAPPSHGNQNWPSNPTQGTIVVDAYGNVWSFDGTRWVVITSGNGEYGMPRGTPYTPGSGNDPWDQTYKLYQYGRRPEQLEPRRGGSGVGQEDN
jgi:hypothetical protein